MEAESQRIQEFTDVLRQKYDAGDFGLDPRYNHRQLEPVAEHFAIDLVPHRGDVVAEGVSGEHYWLQVNGREDIVDVTLPLEDDSFIHYYRAFIAGDIDEMELRDHVMQTSFESRVVGRTPKTVRYLGKPTLNFMLSTGSN